MLCVYEHGTMNCCARKKVTQISNALIVIRENGELSCQRCKLVNYKSGVTLEIGTGRFRKRGVILMSRCQIQKPRNPTNSEQALLYDKVRFGQLPPLCCIDIFQGTDEDSPLTLIRNKQSDWQAVLDHLNIKDDEEHEEHEENDEANNKVKQEHHEHSGMHTHAHTVDDTQLRASQEFMST